MTPVNQTRSRKAELDSPREHTEPASLEASEDPGVIPPLRLRIFVEVGTL